MEHVTNDETTIEASDVLAVGLFIRSHQPHFYCSLHHKVLLRERTVPTHYV